MQLLDRLPFPRRLAARVWLLTLPSALLSFERRQRLPRLPVGRGRLLGVLLIAVGLAAVLRSGPDAARPGAPARGLARLRYRPAVGGGLLLLSGVALLLRSLILVAYTLGLSFAFARELLELEEPQLPGRSPAADDWEPDETLA
jgi:hypothetical protein